MSEKNESLKQIVLAGFNAAAASEDAPIKQTEEELLALIKKLPLDRLRGLRAELDGMIAAQEGGSPEEAIESIKAACLTAPEKN